MKKELTTKMYKEVFRVDENHKQINKLVKAVIVNFGDKRGDIIVKNDNYGTRRKYADFTMGKKEAGLHPMQIVFSGLDFEITQDNSRYINSKDEICFFKDLKGIK